jgi:hypothetical protein
MVLGFETILGALKIFFRVSFSEVGTSTIASESLLRLTLA